MARLSNTQVHKILAKTEILIWRVEILVTKILHFLGTDFYRSIFWRWIRCFQRLQSSFPLASCCHFRELIFALILLSPFVIFFELLAYNFWLALACNFAFVAFGNFLTLPGIFCAVHRRAFQELPPISANSFFPPGTYSYANDNSQSLSLCNICLRTFRELMAVLIFFRELPSTFVS